MKILVQHPEEDVFLNADGAWVGLKSHAIVFANADEAIAFCAKYDIRRIKLCEDLREDSSFNGGPEVRVSSAENQRLEEEQQKLRIALNGLRAQAMARREQHSQRARK